jgi:hypothetical protein
MYKKTWEVQSVIFKLLNENKILQDKNVLIHCKIKKKLCYPYIRFGQMQIISHFLPNTTNNAKHPLEIRSTISIIGDHNGNKIIMDIASSIYNILNKKIISDRLSALSINMISMEINDLNIDSTDVGNFIGNMSLKIIVK